MVKLGMVYGKTMPNIWPRIWDEDRFTMGFLLVLAYLSPISSPEVGDTAETDLGESAKLTSICEVGPPRNGGMWCWFIMVDTASGKRLHDYGTSPCSMGKSTNYRRPFSIAFCVCLPWGSLKEPFRYDGFRTWGLPNSWMILVMVDQNGGSQMMVVPTSRLALFSLDWSRKMMTEILERPEDCNDRDILRLYSILMLVGGLVAINFIFPEILGISSSQLTNIFQRGGPTTNQILHYSFLLEMGSI